jgi:hypothetical protein
MPGNYSDYAADPWKYIWGDIEQVMAGSYKYFYPQRGSGTTAPKPAATGGAGQQ